MANPKIKRTFRLIAIDETQFWCPKNQEIADKPIFGVYLYCEGEATYCASLTPSSWCVFIENRFGIERHSIDPEEELSEAVLDEIESLRDENDRESGSYFNYISNPDKRFISKPFELTMDTREYDGETFAERKEAALKDAWDDAEEHFKNYGDSDIPITCDYLVWRDWAREQSKRIIPTLPLFSGIPAYC